MAASSIYAPCPFVEVSRKKICRDVIRELNEAGVEPLLSSRVHR